MVPVQVQTADGKFETLSNARNTPSRQAGRKKYGSRFCCVVTTAAYNRDIFNRPFRSVKALVGYYIRTRTLRLLRTTHGRRVIKTARILVDGLVLEGTVVGTMHNGFGSIKITADNRLLQPLGDSDTLQVGGACYCHRQSVRSRVPGTVTAEVSSWTGTIVGEVRLRWNWFRPMRLLTRQLRRSFGWCHENLVLVRQNSKRRRWRTRFCHSYQHVASPWYWIRLLKRSRYSPLPGFIRFG